MKSNSVKRLWQPPYIDVFKSVEFSANSTETNKNVKKVGNVQRIMDKTIGKSVIKLTGSVSACNYVEIGNLSIDRRFLYVQIKPFHSKLFTFVIEVNWVDRNELPVRITCSNMYRGDSKRKGGNIVQIALKDMPAKWTVVKLDIKQILESKHEATSPLGERMEGCNRNLPWMIHSLKFCSSMLIRGAYASNDSYSSPHLITKGSKIQIPKSLSLPFPPYHTNDLSRTGQSQKGQKNSIPSKLEWTDVYAWKIVPELPPAIITEKANFHQKYKSQVENKITDRHDSVQPKENDLLSANKYEEKQIDSLEYKLPGTSMQNIKAEAKSSPDVKVNLNKSLKEYMANPISPHVGNSSAAEPLMDIETIVGFSGGSSTLAQISEDKNHTLVQRNKELLKWSGDGGHLVYASSNHIIVSAVSGGAFKGKQKVLCGHTSKISCLDVCSYSRYNDGENKPETVSLVASGEEGKNPVIRLWDLSQGKCLTMIAAQAGGALRSIDVSEGGAFLCSVGKDEYHRLQIMIWDISAVSANVKNNFSSNNKRGSVRLIAKQTSEFDITTIKFSPHDISQLLSCGRENIRFWRIKNGHLVGRPVILNEYARNSMFTDISIERSYGCEGVEDKKVFASSASGTVVVVKYDTQEVECVYRLHDASISTLLVNEGFCVTGSQDEFLRVWPLDFSDYFLESRHEGGIQCLDVSPDGLHIAVGCVNGNMSLVDVTSHSNITILRTHVDSVNLLAFRNQVNGTFTEMATASSDHTIRVWDVSSGTQTYEFCSVDDICSCLCYHPDPEKHILTAGFQSGCTRIFHVSSATTLFEIRQHSSPVHAILIMPDMINMLSMGSECDICVYDIQRDYLPVRMIQQNNICDKLLRKNNNNTTINHSGNESVLSDLSQGQRNWQVDKDMKLLSLELSGDGCIIAYIGYDDGTIRIRDAKTMQEIWTFACSETAERYNLICFSNKVEVIEKKVDGERYRIHVYELIATTKNENQIYKFLISRHQLVEQKTSEQILAIDAKTARWKYSLIKQWASQHEHGLVAICISPCSSYMVTAGAKDNIIKVWKYERRNTRMRVLQTFVGHCDHINEISFSPDGKYFVSVAKDGVILIWQFSSGAYISTKTVAYAKTSPYMLKNLTRVPPNRKAPSPPRITNKISSDKRTSVLAKSKRSNVLPIRHNQRSNDLKVRSSKFLLSCVDNEAEKNVFPKSDGRIRCADGRGTIDWYPSSGLFIYAIGDKLIHEDLATGRQISYEGNNSEIASLALSRKGNLIATASAYNPSKSERANIILWKRSMNSETVSFSSAGLIGHEYGIQSLAFNHDSTLLVSVGNHVDGKICIWNIIKNTLMFVEKLPNVVNDVIWLGNSPLTVGDCGHISTWECNSDSGQIFEHKILPCLENNNIDVWSSTYTCVALAPKWVAKGHMSDYIVCMGDMDGYVTVISAPDGRLLSRWKACNSEITTVSWKDKTLLLGNAANSILAFDVGLSYPVMPSLKQVHPPLYSVTFNHPITSMAWERSGNEGIIGLLDGTIHYTNLKENSVTTIRV